MSLKDNLKKLMIRHGNLSVSDLAKATKLPQPTLHQLYSGTTESPRRKTLEILANYFSVTINQIIGTESLPDTLPKQIKKQLDIKTTPILSLDDLYNWPDKIDIENKEEIILENRNCGLTFAIEMIGSSMEPLFPCGCLLIFDVNKIPKDRDCVIIYLNDTDKFSFKRILMDGNASYIKSINPELNDIATIKVTPNDKIIATLLEARLKF
ncbi:MAG: helix-turn-helix domain-containing protein [Tatlockia sp.]|nr:helix-turn-helix domain-containing protein [Tatlockia sp.]